MRKKNMILPPTRRAPSLEKNHTATLVFRLPPELKAAFNEACWANGLFATEVLRELMQQYIEEHG